MSSPKPTTYMFIPGKNWKLSLAELISFLEARKCKFKITNLSKSFFAFESEKALDPKFIDDLGGTIKIGRVISHVPLKIVEDAFLRRKKQTQAEIKANLSANCVADDIFKAPQKKNVFLVLACTLKNLVFSDSLGKYKDLWEVTLKNNWQLDA